MMLNAFLNNFNLESTLNKILGFIKKVVEESNSSGVVLGLSGGVDSSLTAALCVRALGRKKVLAIQIPVSFTPTVDVADALDLAESLGIRTKTVKIDDACEVFLKTLKVMGNDVKMRMPSANMLARIRMIILYFYANANNYLVAGTSDRSEALIGYFTKYGDGGADFFPIRHLYKTQVRKLAAYLEIPERITLKLSSPQLYPGHKIIDEIPLNYDELDLVLVGLFEYKLSPEKVSEMTNVSLDVVMEVIRRHKRTEHKRVHPPMIEQ